MWLWSLWVLAPSTFCLGKPLLRNSGNPPSSLPHPSSPHLPLANTHPSAGQLHIRVCRRRPRWLFTNGSSVICVKSQCLFRVIFFFKLNWPLEKKPHSTESSAVCSQFISSFLIPLLPIKYILYVFFLKVVYWTLYVKCRLPSFPFLSYFLSNTILTGCSKESPLPALLLPPYS